MRAFVGRSAILLEEARQSIRRFVDDGGVELETGGALFGFDDGSCVRISAASGPGPNAIRGPRHFLRDLNHTQEFATTLFGKSGAQWIGEWHTHPRGPIEPSERDLRTYVKHLFDDELGFQAFVSIIVVPSLSQDESMRFWSLERLEDDVVMYQVEPQLGDPRYGGTV